MIMTTYYYTLRIHSKLSCLNVFSLQLFNKLDLRAYDLTVDLLDVHAVSLHKYIHTRYTFNVPFPVGSQHLPSF